MLHSCNAVDGTAKKTYPHEPSNKKRFVRLLRDNILVLEAMMSAGINLETTRLPVRLDRGATTPEGTPDAADIIYAIHRCTHSPGDELPGGFELIPCEPGITHILVAQDTVRMPDRLVWALLAVAVFAPVNHDQSVPDIYRLTLGDGVMPVNDWWGRVADFPIVASLYPKPRVHMDFDDWRTSGSSQSGLRERAGARHLIPASAVELLPPPSGSGTDVAASSARSKVEDVRALRARSRG